MKSIYDGYTRIQTNGNPIYFAGANTASGFIGDYASIADEKKLERVYVIKGGSGTGKSTFMRRCAEITERIGLPVTRYLCGSDPDSLDCVVLNNRVAVLDGTAPHIHDMIYPGAGSELIDVSRFWDSSLLESVKDKIIEHSAKKTACYQSAYRYFAAAELLEKEKVGYTDIVFLKEKADAYIERLIKKWKKPGEKQQKIQSVRTHALTMKGMAATDTFLSIAKEKYIVLDSYGCASAFMHMLADRMQRAGYSLILSRLPVPDVLCGIFVEDTKTCITVGLEDNSSNRINMTRFVSNEFPDGLRGKIRLASRIQQQECMHEGMQHLAKASQSHFSLEEIYIRAMDFKALGAYTEKAVREIRNRL